MLVTGYEGFGGLVIEMYILIEEMGIQVHTFIKTHQTVPLKWVQFIYTNFISKVEFKKHNEISHFMPMKMTEIKMSNNTKCW